MIALAGAAARHTAAAVTSAATHQVLTLRNAWNTDVQRIFASPSGSANPRATEVKSLTLRGAAAATAGRQLSASHPSPHLPWPRRPGSRPRGTPRGPRGGAPRDQPTALDSGARGSSPPEL